MKVDPKSGLIVPSDEVKETAESVIDPRKFFTKQTPGTPPWGEMFVVEPVDLFHDQKRGRMYLGYGGVILTLQASMLIHLGRDPNAHYRRGMEEAGETQTYERIGYIR